MATDRRIFGAESLKLEDSPLLSARRQMQTLDSVLTCSFHTDGRYPSSPSGYILSKLLIFETPSVISFVSY